MQRQFSGFFLLYLQLRRNAWTTLCDALAFPVIPSDLCKIWSVKVLVIFTFFLFYMILIFLPSRWKFLVPFRITLRKYNRKHSWNNGNWLHNRKRSRERTASDYTTENACETTATDYTTENAVVKLQLIAQQKTLSWNCNWLHNRKCSWNNGNWLHNRKRLWNNSNWLHNRKRSREQNLIT